jgi:excisionase family DNA binding protein
MVRSESTVGTAKTVLVEDGFVTVPEAAKFLSVSRAKMYATMDQGELPFCKFGKSRRIPRKALLEYAERCLQGAGATG